VINAATGERLFASFAYGEESNPDINRPRVFLEAHLGPANRTFPVFFEAIHPIMICGPGGLAETLGYAATPISPASNPLSRSCSGSDGKAAKTTYGKGGTIKISSPAQMAGASGRLENAAEAVGNRFDPDQTNNRDAAKACVTPKSAPQFDLAIKKTVKPSHILAGGRVTDTLPVTINGPDTAPGVKVADTFNRSGRVISVNSSVGSCSKSLPMACSLGDVANGAKVTITVVVEPLSPRRQPTQRGERDHPFARLSHWTKNSVFRFGPTATKTRRASSVTPRCGPEGCKE
jgi:hypothetical protein